MIALPRRCRRAFLKAARCVADSSFVHRSSLIAGLLLATSGGMLAGVGYWVSGGLDYLSAATYEVPAGLDHGKSTRMPSGLSGTRTTYHIPPSSGLNAAPTR